MPRRIIVVGANASGVEAASAARKKDRTAEITLLTLEKNAGYSRCGLPFVIGGQIPAFRDLIVYPPAYFQMLKLNLRTEMKVTGINTKEKTVAVGDKAVAAETLPYDSLVIATGADAFMPPIKGREEKGVALIERGLKGTVVEMLPQVLPQMLDSDMVKIVQDHLTEKGMCILTGKTVEEFLGD